MYPGHSVLQVPVPALEDVVRGRHAHYDPDYVSADPAFVHAHITVLGPWLDEHDEEDADRVAAIIAVTPPFDFTLARLGVFPDGIVHLLPEPGAPFEELTATLYEAFPHHPPYDGAFDVVLPHLTVDRISVDVSVASTSELLGDRLPAACRAERLDLAWWQAGRTHLVRSWTFGG